MAVLLSATRGSAVLVLSGCSGKSDQTEKTLRVGVITYTQDDPFINGLTDELKAQLKAMENKERRIIVSTKSGNDDQQEQNEKVEEMIDAGCDVLCINLVDRTAPSRIIRMARNEDIPVIFFNREPVREDLVQWEKLYYVGCDAEQSGIMQGEIAEEYIKSHPEVDKNQDGKIQYVLLEGEAGHQDAISRTEYSVKTLMKNDVILEKLSYQLADWNRGQAENRMNRLISQYKEQKNYAKVDESYKTLIDIARKANNAGLVARTYDKYILWSDSVKALTAQDELNVLKRKYDDSLQTIEEKDSSLSAKQYIIIGLCILAGLLATALVLAGIVLLRFVLLTRKQKKAIQIANEHNELKTKFIQNISSQMEPTLNTLDTTLPGVRALKGFAEHIQE